MSFAAEPYGVFVDDLLGALTGGVTREEFVFLPERAPYVLAPGTVLQPGTVRVHGLVRGEFFRFVDGADFTISPGGTIDWKAGDPGVPAVGATWPDLGTRFYASYERRPGSGPPPVLTDRNPGSVTRLLAESFAREYAVLSRQLESVYDAAFVDTATGRDLDQVAALVGVERRTRTTATGEVVFARRTPAPADVFVPEATLVSTAEVPAVTVATTEDRVLRTGTLSVAAPVRALVEGPPGVAGANTLTVIHRPMLGIETAANPEALGFSGGDESDESLRSRVRLALQAGGRSTGDAIVGALTSVEGIRAQDVRIVEDHLAFPGVVKIAVASELDDAHARRAVELIEAYRPAGVRVLHNLPVPALPSLPAGVTGTGGFDDGSPQPAGTVEDGIWFLVEVTATVTPRSSTLTAAQKATLVHDVEQVIESFVDTRGVGEPVVYNQLVQAVMAVEGVYDLTLDLAAVPPPAVPPAPPPPPLAPEAKRRNLTPDPPGTRARLEALDVTLRGALIALDVTVQVERLGLAATADARSALETIRGDLVNRIRAFVEGPDLVEITPEALVGALAPTDTYAVEQASYSAEFVDEGLRIVSQNQTIRPGPDQQAWVRGVTVIEETQAS